MVRPALQLHIAVNADARRGAVVSNNRSPLFDDPAFVADLENPDISGGEVSRKWNIAKSAVNKYRSRLKRGIPLPTSAVGTVAAAATADDVLRNSDDTIVSATRMADKAWGAAEWREFIRAHGQDPDTVTFQYGVTSNPVSGYWNKLFNVRPNGVAGSVSAPSWPVVVPGPTFVVRPVTRTPRASKWQTAVLVADPQIGYRFLDDGTMEPFHDEGAIDVALQIIGAENPDQTVVMGDILDLASQGKFAQESGFARSTQPAIDRTTLLGAQLRSATTGKIVYIEGNHDKRMQNFVEANALAAFGLRKGGMPESWPVMSLPNLLRLDEHDIVYKDAYPAAHWWVNDKLRCEHGTKANSSGSTAAQYMNETPHISRAHGHTHRLEVQSKTTYDRLGKIRSMAINPGCLCRVDGAVPSVNGAIGADGRSAQVVENWQQGVVVVRFREGDEFFVDGLIQIDEGRTVYQGLEFVAA